MKPWIRNPGSGIQWNSNRGSAVGTATALIRYGILQRLAPHEGIPYPMPPTVLRGAADSADSADTNEHDAPWNRDAGLLAASGRPRAEPERPCPLRASHQRGFPVVTLTRSREPPGPSPHGFGTLEAPAARDILGERAKSQNRAGTPNPHRLATRCAHHTVGGPPRRRAAAARRCCPRQGRRQRCRQGGPAQIQEVRADLRRFMLTEFFAPSSMVLLILFWGGSPCRPTFGGPKTAW